MVVHCIIVSLSLFVVLHGVLEVHPEDLRLVVTLSIHLLGGLYIHNQDPSLLGGNLSGVSCTSVTSCSGLVLIVSPCVEGLPETACLPLS